MLELSVWLTELMLGERNYRDVRIGQDVRFPLQTGLRSFVPKTEGPATLVGTPSGRYQFRAPILYQYIQTETGKNGAGATVHTAETFCIFDPGILTYALDHNRRHLGGNPRIGAWWEGLASLHVGWHFFERYCSLPGLPPIVYPWKVERILRDDTPYVTLPDADGEPYLGKDTSRQAFTPVPETTARTEPGFDYLLYCRLLGLPSHDRTVPATVEQQVAIDSLPGSELLVQVKAKDNEEKRAVEPPIAATLVRLSEHDPYYQMALLRLHRPLTFQGIACDYAVLLPRYEGEEIRRLALSNQFSGWLRGVPANTAHSAAAFDRYRWLSGSPIRAELLKP